MERKFNQQDRHFLTLLVWFRSACALQIQAGKQVGKFIVTTLLVDYIVF